MVELWCFKVHIRCLLMDEKQNKKSNYIWITYIATIVVIIKLK
jgi:hypothetical protein